MSNAKGPAEATQHKLSPQADAPFNPQEVDCLIAVMLKILDGKCKMPEHEKQRMSALYERYGFAPSQKIPQDYHQLIQQAKLTPTGDVLEHIYETRVLAETMISRPIMKAFKARLRAEGYLPSK